MHLNKLWRVCRGGVRIWEVSLRVKLGSNYVRCAALLLYRQALFGGERQHALIQ